MQLTGRFEDDVVPFLKMVRYPFTISKSSLAAVGAPQTWPKVSLGVQDRRKNPAWRMLLLFATVPPPPPPLLLLLLLPLLLLLLFIFCLHVFGPSGFSALLLVLSLPLACLFLSPCRHLHGIHTNLCTLRLVYIAIPHLYSVVLSNSSICGRIRSLLRTYPTRGGI